MDWPAVLPFIHHYTVVGPQSACSFGSSYANVPASGTWSSANRALYYPFRVGVPITAKLLWCANGTVAGNNIDIGIFTQDGVKLVSSGSTAQSGTSTIQTFDITDTQLPPGLYYMGMAMDGTTGTVFAKSGALAFPRTLGVYQQATAFPLPDPISFATATSTSIPGFGFATRTFV